MFKLLRQLNKLYALDIVSLVAMGNHFHAVVRAPGELPSVEEVDRRFKAYYGKTRMAPDWKAGDNYEKYAHRMRDVSALMKDFQQQYTNWFNRTRPKGRRGRLWANRFKSVILESGRAVWECVQYVEMNPVRAGLVTAPAKYRHSTWGMLCGGGRHPFGVALADHLPPDWRDLMEIEGTLDGQTGTLDDKQIVGCLRIHLARLVALKAGIDSGRLKYPTFDHFKIPHFDHRVGGFRRMHFDRRVGNATGISKTSKTGQFDRRVPRPPEFLRALPQGDRVQDIDCTTSRESPRIS